MFASPLPPGPDIPSIESSRAVGNTDLPVHALRHSAEHQYPFQGYATVDSIKRAASGRRGSAASHIEATDNSTRRQRPHGPESDDLNLTASLEEFVAGIQDLRTDDSSPSLGRITKDIGASRAASGQRAKVSSSPKVRTVEAIPERHVVGNMEDYGRSAYMQSAVTSVFPEAYANSYVVAKDGGMPSIPAAASSYQVVLSDGTSYPSAIFPAGEVLQLLLPSGKHSNLLFFPDCFYGPLTDERIAVCMSILQLAATRRQEACFHSPWHHRSTLPRPVPGVR